MAIILKELQLECDNLIIIIGQSSPSLWSDISAKKRVRVHNKSIV